MRRPLSDHGATLLYLLAVVAGAALRLHDLSLRPLHHDEGVNALFLLDLLRRHHYAYDPGNYHGPLLYYMTAALLKVLGSTTAVLRLWPAVIGTATLFFFWPLRRLIGTWGAAASAWLLALSPVSVYFSRDLIHESWFAGAAALVAGAAVAWEATRRGRYIILGWVGVAVLFASKETAPFVLAALAVGAVAAGLVRRVDWRQSVAVHLFGARPHHAAGILVGGGIIVLLFTSFFSNRDGIFDFFRAYAFWAKTGTGGSGHEKPWTYFFELLWRYERLLYVLGVSGLVLAAIRREAAVAFGAAAAAMLAVHAVIPYKTPWLVQALLPWLAASGGYLFDRAVHAPVARWLDVSGGSVFDRAVHAPVARWLRVVTVVGFVILLAALAHDAYRLSFVDYDDDHETFIYAQTFRGFLDLTQALEAVRTVSPKGLGMPVNVASADHFPLNWYTRDFTRMMYLSDLSSVEWDGPIIASRVQIATLRRSMPEPFRAHTFPLRPGVDLELLVPASLFDQATGIAAPGTWRRVEPVGRLRAAPSSELPAEFGPGLLARAFADADFETAPQDTWPGRLVAIDYNHGENEEWLAPYGIEWSGFLEAPSDGLYKFALESDDGSTLEIGGVMVVDNAGNHALQRASGQILLRTGKHPVRLRYTDFGGGAKLTFKWQPPGSGDELPVPMTVLSHDAAAPAAGR